MQRPPAGEAYRPEIDGLRAFAVTAVVLYHAGLGCPGGYVGVDVFFVISGYLITALLLRETDAGAFSLARFYERRCRRIVPAAAVVVAAAWAAGYWQLLPSDFKAMGQSAAAQAVGAANVFFYAQTTRYFGNSAQSMPLLHFWSLGVEEQFYLVFPLLVWGVTRWRRARGPLLVVFGVLGAASLVVAVRNVGGGTGAAFFLLPGRAWELLLGALVAAWPGRVRSRDVREALGVVGLAAMVVPVFVYGAATPFPGLAALPPCMGTALFILASGGRHAGDTADPADPSTVAATDGRQAWAGRLLARKPVVFVGLISYSLYLWHWPLLVWARYWRFKPLPVGSAVALVTASFVLAVLSWRFIERPVRRRAVLASRRSVFVATAVVLLGTAGVGLATGRRGLPARFSKEANALDAARHVPMKLPQHRPGGLKHDRLMAFGDRDQPQSVLLWGDSHAGAESSAYDAVFRAHGIGARGAIHSSATPLLDYSTTPTTGLGEAAGEYGRAVLDYVRRHSIKTVILVSFWRRDLDADPERFAAAFGPTLDALRELGVTTYVMLQAPGYDADVPKLLAREAMLGRPVSGWRKTRAAYRRENARMFELAKRYGGPDVHFVDQSAAFTQPDTKDLAVTSKGRPMYTDAHHLSAWGAKRAIAPLLEKELAGIWSKPTTRPLVPSPGTPGEG